MGIIKDLWDILKDEPEAREWIKNNTRTSFEYLRTTALDKVRKSPPLTISEEIDRLKTIISELNNDEFP